MEVERENPDTSLRHRRRGAAFDTLGHIIRDVRELLFQNGFVIRNRPGLNLGESNDPLSSGFIKVFNMFESYFEKIPSVAQGINAYILGRRGDGKMRNTSLIELSARHVSEMRNDQGQNNGVIKLRVTRDDEDPPVDNTGVTVADVGTLGAGLEGTTVRIAADGSSGGVILAFITSKDQNPNQAQYRIRILDNGVYIHGLPTSSPGVSGALWRDNNNFVRVVP